MTDNNSANRTKDKEIKEQASEKEGKHSEFDEWSKEDLMKKCKDMDVEGCSEMDKDELIDALQNH